MVGILQKEQSIPHEVRRKYSRIESTYRGAHAAFPPSEREQVRVAFISNGHHTAEISRPTTQRTHIHYLLASSFLRSLRLFRALWFDRVTTKDGWVQTRSKSDEDTRSSTKQFSLRLTYATTFDGCQGVTLAKTTLDLRIDPFAHGQLYTALSRVRSSILPMTEKTLQM
ncbi:hypothetical protein SCLCIDRAFT_1012870 [Scleroderma citrinum Foug A]|uniref:Uncharacterized protein n=1 Tax=Scleroderma citrinum Foug A TaxID=1036808 RepID=A0A0C3EJY5_9AGAM|nr:hypothetical protein SCLCIDRAFT_1012870 [Scleroderma citrinum Foug A]